MKLTQPAVLTVVVILHFVVLWVLNAPVRPRTMPVARELIHVALLPLNPLLQTEPEAVETTPAEHLAATPLPRALRKETRQSRVQSEEPTAKLGLRESPPEVRQSGVRVEESSAIMTLQKEQPAAEPLPTGAVVAPERTASQPLRLDRNVLRQAMEAAKSPTQYMIESSNPDLKPKSAVANERFSRSIANSAKPDCLRGGEPSAVGMTGLLALPSLVLSALKGDCR